MFEMLANSPKNLDSSDLQIFQNKHDLVNNYHSKFMEEFEQTERLLSTYYKSLSQVKQPSKHGS